jgi:excisionase family DNA binding protein
MSDLYLFGVPGLGMILVSLLAVIVWRRASGAEFQWFWAGAGLWAVAVTLKVAFALLANQAAVNFLHRALPPLLFFPGTGLYLGAVSAAFEVGLTWLAGRRWRLMGRDPGKAVAVGVGAGAVEALLLGCITLGAGLAAAAEGDTGEDHGYLRARADVTPLFWLEPPAARFASDRRTPNAAPPSSRALRPATRTPDAEPLLTPAEVATMFRVDPKTVTRWAQAGRVSFIRTPGGHRRYSEDEIREMLAGTLKAKR